MAKAIGSTVDDVFAMPVADLALSVRSENCLLFDNITTLGLLVTCSPGELLRTPNFGRKSLAEIQTVLAAMGLCLDCDPTPSLKQQLDARCDVLEPWVRGYNDQSKKARRNRAICKARRSGQTLQQVGDAYGVSRERVCQLVKREKIDRKRKQVRRRFVAAVSRIGALDLDTQVKALRARRDELRREEDEAREERRRQEHAAMVAARTEAQAAWHLRVAAERAEEAERQARFAAEEAEFAARYGSRMERQRRLEEKWPCPGCGKLCTMGADLDAGWRQFPVWIVCTQCGYIHVVEADLSRHGPNEAELAQALEHKGLRDLVTTLEARRRDQLVAKSVLQGSRQDAQQEHQAGPYYASGSA